MPINPRIPRYLRSVSVAAYTSPWGPTDAAEDGHERASGIDLDWNYDGSVRNNSGTSLGAIFVAFWRFANVGVPQGATIDGATFTTYLKPGIVNANTDFHGEDVDDSLDSTTLNDIVPGRTDNLTTASTALVQDGLPSNTAIEIDVQAIIQEIVDRPGFEAGNAIGIISYPRMDVAKSLWHHSIEGGLYMPTLEIEFTE